MLGAVMAMGGRGMLGAVMAVGGRSAGLQSWCGGMEHSIGYRL